MKTTPKGIESLTDDERRVTRIDEARPIPGFPNYYITPAGWVWSCRKNRGRGGFLKHTGKKHRNTGCFGYSLCNEYDTCYFSVQDLVSGIFNTKF